MHTKHIIAAVAALLGSASIFAQAVAPAAATPVAAAGANVHVCQNEAECDQAPPRASSVTRAQVLAELYRARAAGEICGNEDECDQSASLRRR